MGRRGGTWIAMVASVALAVGGCAGPAVPTSQPPAREAILDGPIRHPFRDSEVGLTLTRYEVRDGELTDQRVSAAVPEELVSLRDDRPLHREAWTLWWALAPEPWRGDVSQLLIATDGTDGILASVAPRDADLDEWILHVDPAELEDQAALEETMVHELAHVFSLRRGQVLTTPSAAWGYPTIRAAREACAPRSGIEDGCLADDAYLSAFIRRFWDAALLARADAVVSSSDPEAAALELFDEDPLRFANDYAATHPVEDFAESWVTFVLYEYEGVDEEWASKAVFFETYPELVDARTHIWELLDIVP